MKNKISNSLLILAAAALMIGSAVAQTSTPPAAPPSDTAGAGPDIHDPGHPRVNQVNNHETANQNRIAKGIDSGKLSPAQAAHLEKNQQHIENQEKRDMAKHNGHLTANEKAKLNHEEDKQHNKIYKDKHQ